MKKIHTLNTEQKKRLEEKILIWVSRAKSIAPEKCPWIGIYFKASFWLGEDSTDLVLGPFLGETTTHTRIPLNQGICGLALREEKTANISDVKAHPEYLSCSLKTKSELVIPLKDREGNFIAELDIDSHHADDFDSETVMKFEEYCLSFAQLFEDELSELEAKLDRAMSLTHDFADSLSEDSFAQKLSNFPSNTIGQQLWCIIGARKSYLKALQAGSWQGFDCPLDWEDTIDKNRVLHFLESSQKEILSFFYQQSNYSISIALDLLEHEVQHHGQLIRYLYGLKLEIPQSWKTRYALS